MKQFKPFKLNKIHKMQLDFAFYRIEAIFFEVQPLFARGALFDVPPIFSQ